MKLRSGDRVSTRGYTMEILEVGNQVNFKVISSEDQVIWKLGEIASITRDYTWDGWEYLGNFAKPTSFNTLYNKLNEGR